MNEDLLIICMLELLDIILLNLKLLCMFFNNMIFRIILKVIKLNCFFKF